jgi:hypothetical protein
MLEGRYQPGKQFGDGIRILKLARTFQTSLRTFSKIIADFWAFLEL